MTNFLFDILVVAFVDQAPSPDNYYIYIDN